MALIFKVLGVVEPVVLREMEGRPSISVQVKI